MLTLIPRAPSRPGLAHDATSIPTDLIVAATICLFLTTSAVCARMFTKLVDLRRMQVDDYAIIFAAAGFIAFTGLLFASARTGLGSPLWSLSPKALEHGYLYSNILDIVYTPIMFAAKLAILVQIDRMFSGMRKKLIYWGVRVLIVLNALCYGAMFFAYVFACVPRTKIPDPSSPGKCISQNAAIIATGTINVTSDIAILLFAVWGVSRVHLTGKRQTLVALVFSVGSFACVASACRLVYGVKVDGSMDFTIAIWPVHMWSLAELTSIIYVACCPTFPRLLKYIQRRKAVNLPSPSPAHSKWSSSTETRIGATPTSNLSSMATRVGSSPNASKTHLFLHTPSPTLSHQKSLPRFPEPRLPPRQLPHSIYSLSHSLSKPAAIATDPRLSYFAPSERPISHLSYESRTTMAIDEILSNYDGTGGVPDTPVSPARTEFSVGILEDAVRMKIMPVYFATIKKTTDVRVESHTNPGTPVAYGAPDPRW